MIPFDRGEANDRRARDPIPRDDGPRCVQAELGRLMKRDEETVRRIMVRRGVSLNLTLKALAALGVVPALAV
jgi:hypothetical protein